MFELFKLYASQALKAGRKHYSAYTIIERIRWHETVDTASDDQFKISNNHIPYYSRLLMLTDKQFDGFFQRIDVHFDATDEMILEAHSQAADGLGLPRGITSGAAETWQAPTLTAV